ncbi:downstream neighbor of Son [Trifolium repens]|nr:downstream neighbor of Son [Trifolium repens]
MAKVATPNAMPPNSHGISSVPLKGVSIGKRKTPSELRGEQLRRESVVDLTDQSSQSTGSINATEVDNRFKKPGLFRAPRYNDTRLDEVFAAKKPRFRIATGKENVKENPSVEQTSNLKNASIFSNSTVKRQQGVSCLEKSAASGEVTEDSVLKASETKKKYDEGKFLSVADLSSAVDRSSGVGAIDMGKALKGLASLGPCADNGLAADSPESGADPAPTIAGNSFSECHIPGKKAPLDLTLKTSMRIVSSAPANWNEDMRGSQGFQLLHSWMYPQSILPPSIISVLSSSTAEGELEFLRKRQVAWEESFRDLYYMLRKNICGLFYVCTSQFVVMFTGGDGSGKSNCSCNAYISQSTRGLRSLLREHDLCFSMPLCRSKVEQVTTEDLVELSEIEKQNLGQTRRSRSFSDVDNSPESLLVFSGNNNVHGLYDLLFNYRTLLTSLSSVDVPVLCSPAPFQSSALTSPDIKCMEMRRAEDIAANNGSIWKDNEFAQGSSDGLFCSIEIKDTFIPPWIICRICALMGSKGKSFEASFVTKPVSIGLNVALKSTGEKSESKASDSESLRDGGNSFGIPEAAVTSSLYSCTLKSVKYCDGSYIASLSPV